VGVHELGAGVRERTMDERSNQAPPEQRDLEQPLWDWINDTASDAATQDVASGTNQRLLEPNPVRQALPGRAAFRLFTDGASRGNPGPAGLAYCLEDRSGQELAAGCAYIGTTTNNAAEYMALIEGLRHARALGIDRLDVYMDSELVVRQMNGQYRVRDAKLRKMYEDATALVRSFSRCEIWHIDRAQNARADALANQAIDKDGPGKKVAANPARGECGRPGEVRGSAG